MYTTKPAQKSLLDVESWLPDGKRRRLDESWAGVFQRHVTPLLVEMEPKFAAWFHPTMGAPNKPISMMIGVNLLQNMFGLSDGETVETLDFNMQWHYALDVPSDRTQVSVRTLFNFRRRLMEEDGARELTADLIDSFVEAWNVKTSHVRLDSTQVMSNMTVLTRYGLFVQTIATFLRKLAKVDSTALDALPKRLADEYLNRNGYFGHVNAAESRRRLPERARDAVFLVDRFAGCSPVCDEEAYRNLARLVEEQCQVGPAQPDQPAIEIPDGDPSTVESPGGDPPDTEGSGDVRPGDEPSCDDPFKDDSSGQEADQEPTARPARTDEDQECEPDVRLKEPGDVGLKSLQNPSDPDATFSAKKGPGYQVQIAETCHEDNELDLIVHVETEGAHASDMAAVQRVHEDLETRGHDVEKTYVDAGYVSAENILRSEDRGIDLVGPARSGRPPGPKRAALGEFEFTADRQDIVACPEGHAPIGSQPLNDETGARVYFDPAVCAACPRTSNCPVESKSSRRVLIVRPAEVVLAQRRVRQETDVFKQDYKIRSGIEATNSQLKNHRAMGRQSVRGSPAVSLRVRFQILAENCHRVVRHALETVRKERLAQVGA